MISVRRWGLVSGRLLAPILRIGRRRAHVASEDTRHRAGTARPLILIEPNSVVSCVFFKQLLPVLPSPRGVQPHVLSAAIRRLRLCYRPGAAVRSGAVRVLGTGAACRWKGGAYCLSFVDPRTAWRVGGMGDAGRGVVSTGPEVFRVGFLRLVAGLGD